MQQKLIRITTVDVSLNSLLKGQLQFLNQHYEVVGIAGDSGKLNVVSEREGIRTINVSMQRHISVFKDFVSLIKMIKILRREKPLIVHSITPKAGLVSMLAAWFVRVPIRIHMFTGLVFPTATGLKQKLLMTTDGITCKCATNVYAEGKGVKNDLEKYKITRKPIKIIANGNVNGIDTNHFNTNSISQSKAEIRNSLNIPQGAFVFVFVGRMVGDKGINELINAFCKLYATNNNLRLILVGPFEKKLDPLLPETEKTILNHEAIKFMDFQEDVRPFFKAADALVFPSYREGFPNVVMQAGAMDLPSIVTDINGCNEIIVNNKNGVIIPPKNENELYNAMNDFINNQDKTKTMASVAREMITSRYEQQMVWQALLEEYNRLSDEKKNR